MPAHVIIVEKRGDFRWPDPGGRVATVEDYLGDPQRFTQRNPQIINLCRNYDYLSVGYYCSLLAEARQDKVVPSVATLVELERRSIYRFLLAELDVLLRKVTRRDPPKVQAMDLYVVFGRPDDSRFDDLADRAFDLFRCPLLKLELVAEPKWHVKAIEPLSLKALPEALDALFQDSLERFTRRRWPKIRARTGPRYDLAILHDPQDKLPPSDARTLQKFVSVGEQMGIDVELIERRDFSRLAEFDALFIRETTAIPHHTYRFAVKAQSEGMPVMDDPASIIRCTNKVFLAELLRTNGVPTPRTLILSKPDAQGPASQLGYPLVLKIPDGSFSRGVKKVDNADEFVDVSRIMLKDSELILAQEFMPTEFDWRIGVLEGQAIFACQYMMARKHWQIINHGPGGTVQDGAARTFAVEDVPKEVVRVAEQAARLIGDGLYGVDLKQTKSGVFVIEVNDNPNIDCGVEDKVLRDDLYRLILGSFQRRLEARRA
ncbi:RimK family protein [Zavarzinia sp. CC-PAN008]|uniref:RimK family protein n=1 Tax=Zavarzinia sp. CC-PAN008 TaxID=3243332 RepID=UPI003F74A4A8